MHAGLVYKHYGKEIIASAMGLPAGHADVDTVYLAVYKSFMEAIDAIDNGVCRGLTGGLTAAGVGQQICPIGTLKGRRRPAGFGVRACACAPGVMPAVRAGLMGASGGSSCRCEPVGQRCASQVCQQHGLVVAGGAAQPRLERRAVG